MLANFFDKSKPINFIVILALFFIYFLIGFFTRFSTEVFTVDLFLQNLLIIGLCLFLFFMFNFVISKNKLTEDSSYAFLLLIILLGSFSDAFFDVKTLILNILTLFFLRKIYSLKKSKSVFEKLFDAGFWVGILFIIEPFFAILFALLYLATYLFQQITFRTILIPVLGFITPLIVFFGYCFWFDKITDFELLFSWYTNFNFDIYLIPKLLIPIVIFFGLAHFALIAKTPKKLSVSGNERKNWILLFFQMIISVGIILLLKERNGSEILLVFFPIIVIITNWLEHLKSNLIKNVLLIFLVALPFLLLII